MKCIAELANSGDAPAMKAAIRAVVLTPGWIRVVMSSEFIMVCAAATFRASIANG